MELHRGDPIGLDGVVTAGKEGLHIADEGAGDLGREFDRLAGHAADIGYAVSYCESYDYLNKPLRLI